MKGDDGSEPVSAPFRQLRKDLAYLDIDVSTEVLAEVLGITDRRIRQLVEDDKVERVALGRFGFLESVKRYIASLRETASGRGGVDEQASLAVEQARLAGARAEHQEMKNAVLRGDLVERTKVEQEWTDDYKGLSQAMLNIPARLQQSLPHLHRNDVTEIDRLIRAALTEAANGHDAKRPKPK